MAHLLFAPGPPRKRKSAAYRRMTAQLQAEIAALSAIEKRTAHQDRSNTFKQTAELPQGGT